MKMVVTGVVLAAGCSSPPTVTRGSVNSCFQFAAGAIQRHVTVTTVPAACQGLSQLEVNVAVGRALQAAAAGARGKVAQRELIARDSPYVAGLIHAVPAPGQNAVAASQARPPSGDALNVAALVAWLVTVGLGLSMMARWLTRTRRQGPQPRRGHGATLNFTHFGLALTGLLVWISYLATGVTGLAWAACGLLLAVASLGLTLVFLAPSAPSAPSAPAAAAPARSENDPPPAGRPPIGPPPIGPPPIGRPPIGRPPIGRPPALVVAAHITAACLTILLATLAAIGSG